MRGKVDNVRKKAYNNRITPAYAGKRLMQIFRMDTFGDHPRLCGEKFQQMISDSKNGGSPPPMRGKGFQTFRKNGTSGITPAYAGKSPLCFCTGVVQRDHPRLCGEKSNCQRKTKFF